MAQLVVRRLDDGVKERLKARAKKHGRSLEAEARAILEEAAEGWACTKEAHEKGLATRMSERFKGIGFTDEEYREFQQGIERDARRERPPVRRVRRIDDRRRHECRFELMKLSLIARANRRVAE